MKPKSDLWKLAELITDEPKETKTRRYKATAYLERCLRGAMDGIDTNDWSQIDDFVWKNCQQGLTCEIINNETGERRYAYPDNFSENTIGVEDLYNDLRLEQQEQM